MRDILFKAKRVGDSEWVEGLFCKQTIGSLFFPCIQVIKEWDNGDYIECHEVDPETVCQWTGLITHGKKIKVYDSDKWSLSFYSQTVHGYITNQGTIERDKNGMWVCSENPGVNKFELLSMVEDYEGAFEITGNVHDKATVVTNNNQL